MKNKKILVVLGAVWMASCVLSFAADKDADSKVVESASPHSSKRMLKLDDGELDLNRLEKEGQINLNDVYRREKSKSGKVVNTRYLRRARYFSRNKHVALIESKIISDEAAQGYLKVYGDNGAKVLEAQAEPGVKGEYMEYEDATVLGDHHVVTIASKYVGENLRELSVFNIGNHEVVFSTGFLNGSYFVPPSEDYLLLLFQNPQSYYGTLYKYNFKDVKKITEGERLSWNTFSNDGKSYVLTETQRLEEKALSGRNMLQTEIMLYTDDVLRWKKMVKYETMRISFSASDKYLILQFGKNYKFNERGNVKESELEYSIFESASGKMVVTGRLSPENVESYKAR